jgi:acylphosphatase
MLDNTLDNEIMRIHAIVEGDVQGVGFRAFVQRQAINLRLKGWVRNLWDGNVEVLAEGERTHLNKLLDALWRGPSGSHVTQVIHEWQESTGESIGFSIKFTS